MIKVSNVCRYHLDFLTCGVESLTPRTSKRLHPLVLLIQGLLVFVSLLLEGRFHILRTYSTQEGARALTLTMLLLILSAFRVFPQV